MGPEIYQVDAFTSDPYRGNPAAVCLLDSPGEEAWMQKVAREMNLSETAFLHSAEEGFGLRWFTPAVEVDLCGHATLASAHILWETGRLPPGESARFHTLSGLLTARREGEDIELDFPATPEEAADPPEGLIRALGVKPVYVGRNRFDYLVEVASEEEIREATPDFTLLGKVSARGIMVTSIASSPGFDFVSRFFAPAAGIDEDPVTGSSHCTLGPYWARRLGRQEFNAWQASARGGALTVRVAGDRVLLGGRAVTILKGELVHDPERQA